MAKRFICFLLSAVMMISILPAGILSAAAEEETAQIQETTVVETTAPVETTVPEDTTAPEETTPPVVDTGYNGHKASDACIAILKQEEGFSERPYWDYSQWTVGFGTKCPDDMLEKYKADGITEAEAETLLRNHLFYVYKDIVTYMEKNGLTLTQNQFDALVLFSYNCGTSWCFDTSGTLYKAVAGGSVGNDLIRAFALWCIAGGQVQDFLIRRRLSEANMYLNNVYSRTPPDNYCYVLYNANGGSVSPKSQGYDSDLTAAPYPTPTFSGYTFAGWYTQATGGTKVTVLDSSTKGKTLYAQWTDAGGNTPESNEQSVNVTVTVTSDSVNLRKGPGTNYTIVGTANTGKQFTITAIATGSGYTWGQYDGGWVCLKYTNYDSVKDSASGSDNSTNPDSTEKEETSTSTAVSGTVKANGGLCVRSGAGTGYGAVRYIANGSKVEILEQKTVGAMTWGRISDGWISMKYVVLDTASEGTTSGGSTSDNSNDTSSSATAVTGTVTAVGGLRVRSGAGVSYSIVKTVAKGTKVTITETKAVGSVTWGKIADGWISMDYVSLDGSNSSSSNNQTAATQSGTVKVSGNLRVRSGPGTSYAVCGYLYNGNTVQITETKTVGATVWGKIATGWISMDYVVLSGSGNSGAASTSAKTVTASCLCVRSGAGTGNQIVGYLYSGSKVEILETKAVDGTTWGRISSGWICMDYVK